MDWRIGCKCQPKYKRHPMQGCTATVREVHPDGYADFKDPNGVLELLINTGQYAGVKVFDCADNWVTA